MVDHYYDSDLEFEERRPRPKMRRTIQIDPVKLQHYIDLRRSQSYLPLAVVAGLIGAGLGAAAWLGITAFSDFRATWMAIGVGLIVGWMVRISGRGIDWTFGATAALMTAVGSTAGALLAGCWAVARESTKAEFVDLLTHMTTDLALRILGSTVTHVDFAYLGAGMIVAYWFAIRRITRDDLAQLANSGPLPGQPGPRGPQTGPFYISAGH